MAKKPISLSLPSDGSNDSVPRGDFDIPKGMACKGLRLKVVAPINNTSGGAVTLSDAQKQALLADFMATVTFGPRGTLKPYVAALWTVFNRACRWLYGTEIEGYTDTSTGLQRSLPNSATTNVTFYLIIPLGYFWKLYRGELLAFGRTQMRTLQLDVRRTASTILSGVIVSGTVTIDVMPDLVPCKGDPVSPGIFYEEVDDARKTVELSEGMPLAVEERTAIHASSTITNFSLKIDDLEVHDQVSPAEAITEQNDIPNYPSEAAPTDRTTHLYTVQKQGGSAELKDLPTGKPKITQNVKDLATIKLSQFYIPITSPEDVNSMMEFASGKKGRSKTVRGVSTQLTEGLGLGRHQAFVAPFNLVDQDADEFERFPGPVAESGKKVDVAIPNTVLDAARARIAKHLANGERKAAENVAAELAATIPGAVQSARGFKRGDQTMIDRVKRSIG